MSARSGRGLAVAALELQARAAGAQAVQGLLADPPDGLRWRRGDGWRGGGISGSRSRYASLRLAGWPSCSRLACVQVVPERDGTQRVEADPQRFSIGRGLGLESFGKADRLSHGAVHSGITLVSPAYLGNFRLSPRTPQPASTQVPDSVATTFADFGFRNSRACALLNQRQAPSTHTRRALRARGCAAPKELTLSRSAEGQEKQVFRGAGYGSRSVRRTPAGPAVALGWVPVPQAPVSASLPQRAAPPAPPALADRGAA